jgi:hypothetical protein
MSKVLPICPKCQERNENNTMEIGTWPVVLDGVIHLRWMVDGIWTEGRFLCGEPA